MKFYICAFIKDSHWYLDEWIRHHLDIGFDEIFLVEDFDSQPHNEITDKYQQVTLTKFKNYLPNVNQESGITRQKQIYNKFCFQHKEGWCAFIDDDEFIELSPGITLETIANKYSDCRNVLMSWKIYGANNHIKRTDNLQNSYTFANVPGLGKWQFKTFVNLSFKYNTFPSVHLTYCDIFDYTKSQFQEYIKEHDFESYIHVNHYATKSWEDWMWKICKRGNPTRGLRKLGDFFHKNPDMLFAYDLLMAEQDFDKVDFEALQIKFDELKHTVSSDSSVYEDKGCDISQSSLIYDEKYSGEHFNDEWKKFCLSKKDELQASFPNKNIDNPQTLSEKIQWLKIYDSTLLKAYCADKITLRDYCRYKLGIDICIPLIGTYDEPEKIDWDNLPDKFVIKCNHGYQMNIIVTDKHNMDINKICEKLYEWLNFDFGTHGYQLHYSLISPKVLIEQYMEDKSDGILTDYKFMCFNGEVKYIQVINGRNTKDMHLNFYDTDFNPMTDVSQKNDPADYSKLDMKPVSFELMKKYATKLSEDFKLVRVDFYEIDGNPYLGEMTFTPVSGMMGYTKPEIDLRFGQILKL